MNSVHTIPSSRQSVASTPEGSAADGAGLHARSHWRSPGTHDSSATTTPRQIRRIALSTGGGDAPGLNAVIRAATLAAHRRGWDVLGIRRGYQGLFEEQVDGEPGLLPLTPHSVRGITHIGGTILGTTGRGRPFGVESPGLPSEDDGEAVAGAILDRFQHLELDALIAIGGDGSLRVAHRLHQKGMPVVGVPKTIDNDLHATDLTFGFRTAVEVATDAIGRLHSTAEAHQRVMVVEVMGRHAGWIALESGLAGGADIVLIPEIPYHMDRVVAKIQERDRARQRFSIVVVAEGAHPVDNGPSFLDGTRRYGGIADSVALEIERCTGRETRTLVLGHIQRGGSPIAYDRLLALQLGAAAVQFIDERRFGHMVALRGQDIVAAPLDEVVGTIKQVPVDSHVLAVARQLGVCLGD
jgi:ATP-dependent phosphofructokinase / diphosphate-dependent phosphofructokinase